MYYFVFIYLKKM